MFENGLWLMLVAGGPVLIGVVLAWMSWRTRRLRQRDRELNEPHHG